MTNFRLFDLQDNCIATLDRNFEWTATSDVTLKGFYIHPVGLRQDFDEVVFVSKGNSVKINFSREMFLKSVLEIAKSIVEDPNFCSVREGLNFFAQVHYGIDQIRTI